MAGAGPPGAANPATAVNRGEENVPEVAGPQVTLRKQWAG